MSTDLSDLAKTLWSAVYGQNEFEGAGAVNFWTDDLDENLLAERVRPYLVAAYHQGFEAAKRKQRRVREANPYKDYGDRSLNDEA